MPKRKPRQVLKAMKVMQANVKKTMVKKAKVGETKVNEAKVEKQGPVKMVDCPELDMLWESHDEIEFELLKLRGKLEELQVFEFHRCSIRGVLS